MIRRDAEILQRMELENRVTYADVKSVVDDCGLAKTTIGKKILGNHPESPNSSIVKIRQKDPFARMRTKLEKDYANHLEVQRKAGLIDEWRYEWVTFVLADDANNLIRYTPDFAIIKGDELRFVESKGFWHVAGLLKFRLARAQLPFELVAVRRIKGEWVYTDTPSRDKRKGE